MPFLSYKAQLGKDQTDDLQHEVKDQVKQQIFNSLNEVLFIVVNWAMKFTAMKLREKQAEWFAKSVSDTVSDREGVEMLPVYLSIFGNFRMRQVKNIDACRWRQARKSLAIQN